MLSGGLLAPALSRELPVPPLVIEVRTFSLLTMPFGTKHRGVDNILETLGLEDDAGDVLGLGTSEKCTHSIYSLPFFLPPLIFSLRHIFLKDDLDGDTSADAGAGAAGEPAARETKKKKKKKKKEGKKKRSSATSSSSVGCVHHYNFRMRLSCRGSQL